MKNKNSWTATTARKPTPEESHADFRKRKEARDRFKRRQMVGKNK